MPRINKTKDQIAEDIKRTQKVAHLKEVVKIVFPLLTTETIYDAQTALNALVGFVKADLQEKQDAVKMSEVVIDLSKEKESSITKAMEVIKEALKDEPADEVSQTLERLSRAFGEFGSMKFLKNPMSELKLEELLAE